MLGDGFLFVPQKCHTFLLTKKEMSLFLQKRHLFFNIDVAYFYSFANFFVSISPFDAIIFII